MDQPCGACKTIEYIRVTEYGTLVCTRCGIENFNFLESNGYVSHCSNLYTHTCYTRLKRFRKYLQRAGMQQSSASIPEATWSYLLAGVPFRGPGNIVRYLKKAPKRIRKKCYDSLPLLVMNLCPHIKVPTLTEADTLNAMSAFQRLDEAYNNGEPFVSYLFVLEYILGFIGRTDMLPFINKISCRKRRAAYRLRLNRIYQ